MSQGTSSRTPSRNVDSYELNSSDSDHSPRAPPSAATVESRSGQPDERHRQFTSNYENLPSHLIERLNRLSHNDSPDTLNYATADFDDDISDDDLDDDDDCDDDEYEFDDGGSITSETASNSSSVGAGNNAASSSTANAQHGDSSSSDSSFVAVEQINSDQLEIRNATKDDKKTKHKKSGSSSSVVLSTLKKRWRGVKKSTAGKGLSSISSSYFGGGKDQETPEERQSRISDEWVNCIIPAWKKKRKTGRVRTLIFRGIPVNVRGQVWKCAIGNPLNISEELYTVLKDRATKGRELFELVRSDNKSTFDIAGDVHSNEFKQSNSKQQFDEKGVKMEENERNAHKAISLDLPRTFPELTFFHIKGSTYENALRDILQSFLYLKPDIGYSQGMSFLAAVLLLYMDSYDAFCCFSNMLLYKSCFLNFFRIKMPEVKVYLLIHEKFLEEEMPSLYNHFKKHGIESDLYMINWVMSLYCRALTLELVTRIWDLYVLDGDVAIFRSALGILKMFMNRLLKMKFEDMAYFLSHLPCDEIDPDQLLRTIRSVRVVTKRKFIDSFKQFRSQYPE